MTRTGKNRSAYERCGRRGPRAGVSACALLAVLVSSAILAGQTAAQRTFGAPEDAVKALVDTAKKGDLEALMAIFGPEGRDLLASSDAATARMNRQVFTVAVSEIASP